MYVCMYVCIMSCYCINYAYNLPGQCATRVLTTSTSHVFVTEHCIVLSTDMEDTKLEVEEKSARRLTVQRHSH